MCGICGAAWTDQGRGLSDAQLDRMIDRLRHRGPDDRGMYCDTHAGLGFRRLSIIDLFTGHQPLSNEDGTVWVVFNGEIYNYAALRHRLEARGHRLRSSGDTEVLVHLYEDEREHMFAHLRGMFALAIWDSARRCLLLARDRLGQKPLLYRREADRILFASELKSLLTLPDSDLPRVLDPVALDRYLTYGYVPHDRTILQGVHKLPPAHYARWQDGALTLVRYWTPEWNREVTRDRDQDAAMLREALSESVREQMVSDVPLGAFLSGGVDSTIIAGLMQQHSRQPVKTFSIGFDDPAFDETAYANLAARQLGTEHHSFRVEPKAWETIPALAETFDEPFADSSALPTWFVARETRAHVTVALTGDAGDELFGGYDRYRALALTESLAKLPMGAPALIGGALARAIPASARAKTRLRSVRRLLEGLADPTPQRYLRWMVQFDEKQRLELYDPAHLDLLARASPAGSESLDPASVFLRAWNAAPRRDPVTRAMIADLLTYLPGDLLHKVDMTSMAHSLECRCPFLDHRVVELALAMPVVRKMRLRRGRSKLILKQAFSELLPPPTRTRSKMGFGVPLDRWFRGPLKSELRAVLLDDRAVGRGLFRRAVVERMIAEHESGKRDHAYRLWNLMMLELWFQQHFQPPAR